jgi:hypothetical protein
VDDDRKFYTDPQWGEVMMFMEGGPYDGTVLPCAVNGRLVHPRDLRPGDGFSIPSKVNPIMMGPRGHEGIADTTSKEPLGHLLKDGEWAYRSAHYAFHGLRETDGLHRAVFRFQEETSHRKGQSR